MTPNLYAAFDSSDYRQNTYGPPNHYCDPARSLINPGAGTLANPWNLTQAMQLAVAGDVVGFLPGVGAVMTSTNDDNIPTFRPTNSGSVNNRIVFVTRYAAVALANVATNPNRTQLRHNGTRAVAAGMNEIGTGSAMYGVNGRSYVTFDGFFVDMAEAQPKGDSGVIRVEGGTGVHFLNFEIKGTRTNMQSNPVMYRPGGAVDTVLSNFRAYDFSNDMTNSDTPQAALFSDQYGDQNVLIEHFEIRNTERGIFFKGRAGALNELYNYGTVRYGSVSEVSSCFMFDFLHASQLTTLHNVLCYDVNSVGVEMRAQTEPARNFLAHHVTVARFDSASSSAGGCFKVRGYGIVQRNTVTFRDNLCDLNSAGNVGRAWEICEYDPSGCVASEPSIPVMNYNGYYKNGDTPQWQLWNGGDRDYNTIAAWRGATGQEANSNVLPSAPFVDRLNENFQITPGHAAQTASSTGGEIGAYATNEVIGVDVGTATPPPPASTSYTLRFYGHGVSAPDLDRVKISLDNPVRPIDIGNTDFTVEFWMKALGNENTAPACSPGNDNWITGNILLDRDIFGNGDHGDYGVSLTAGRLAVGVNNGTAGIGLCGTRIVADGIWHHVAITRRVSTGEVRVFVDGTLDVQGSGAAGNISYRDGRTSSFLNDPYLVIGAEKHDAGAAFPSFSGWIDELRISNALRYSADFSRPSAPFTPDAQTVALYHFDEGTGDVIGDSAGASGGPSQGVRRFGGSAPAGPQWVLSDIPFTSSPPSNRCDLNGGGVTVVDVQLCVNQALSITPCTTGDIDQNTQCNVIDVQRVVNAALGGACVTQ